MRYNGLQLVIGMALDELALPSFSRHADALVLGAIREDIVYSARRRRIREHWSLTHFSGRWLGGGFFPFVTAGAPTRAQALFERAVESSRRGRSAEAMVQLGRASHLLIDMACPVHAQRVAHWSDGYEWYVEGHMTELRALGSRPTLPAPRSAHDAAAGLARVSQRFEADGTHHLWGALLHRLGLRRRLAPADHARQAAAIIPLAAGALAAVYRLFLDATVTPSS